MIVPEETNLIKASTDKTRVLRLNLKNIIQSIKEPILRTVTLRAINFFKYANNILTFFYMCVKIELIKKGGV